MSTLTRPPETPVDAPAHGDAIDVQSGFFRRLWAVLVSTFTHPFTTTIIRVTQ